MTKFCTPISILFATLALAFAAPLQSTDTAPMTKAEIADLKGALERGLDLYRYDQAAWHTTDTLLEDIADPGKKGIHGWVVTSVENGMQVTYWKPTGDSFEAVYSAIYNGSEVVSRTVHTPSNATLTSSQLALVRASRVPETGKLMRCSDKPFNTVIMPSGKNSGSIYVYFLTPYNVLNEIPFGGHYRFEVLDGEVLEQRAFTKSCIALSLTGEQNDKGEPIAVGISHSLDPTPTEVHVFSMFTARVPLYVVTISPKRTWVVEASGGQPRARLLDR